MDDLDRRIDKAFTMVAFAANRHLVDHMRRMTTTLDMDLESAMLWGTLAHLNVAQAIRPGAPPTELLAPDGFLLGAPTRSPASRSSACSALPASSRASSRIRGQTSGAWRETRRLPRWVADPPQAVMPPPFSGTIWPVTHSASREAR